MNQLVACAALSLVVVACKPEEVPFKPPPPDDAAAAAADAAVQAIDAPPPVKPTATKVAVGDHASCAVMTDATVRCWGKNSDGQLGNGTTTDAAIPVAPNLRGVKDVVLGTAHACALLDDSSVTCWGRINYGKRGNLLVPTAVPGLARAERLFAIGTASCATLADSSLVCWGDVDVRGHLRLSGATPEQRVPTPTAGVERVVALTANGALHEDGSVTFWGGTGGPRRTPLAGVVELASSGDEVCGLRRDGSVACIGPTTHCASALPKAPAPKPSAPRKSRVRSKTKHGTNAAKAKPPKPAAGATPEIVEVLQLPKAKHLAFDVGLCVVTATGRLQCLNGRDACRLDDPWPGLAKVDQVSGFCARIADGRARCWAVDSASRVVAAVAGVAGASAIVASSTHACALLRGGVISCWGSNKFGALGRGESHDGVHREAKAVAF